MLERSWKRPFTTKSDYAREAALTVAVAASDGFITTKIACGLYGSRWQITPRGLKHLFILTGVEDE